MSQETITVEAVSRNGVLFNGMWYNFGKFSKTNSAAFRKGENYLVDITLSKAGGRFINFIAGQTQGEGTPAVSSSTSDTLPKPQYDPHAKDAQIRFQGCWQAAVQSPYLGTKAWESEAELLAFVKRLADSGVEYIVSNLEKKDA